MASLKYKAFGPRSEISKSKPAMSAMSDSGKCTVSVKRKCLGSKKGPCVLFGPVSVQKSDVPEFRCVISPKTTSETSD